MTIFEIRRDGATAADWRVDAAVSAAVVQNVRALAALLRRTAVKEVTDLLHDLGLAP